MLNTFQKTCNLMDRLFTWTSVLLLGTIIVASSLQVFTRYVLNDSMVGTEEAARFCFIWMSMLGGSVCVGRHAHPAVTFIGDMLRGVSRKVLSAVIHILIVLCSLIFVVYGFRMFGVTGNQFSPTLGVRMCWVYLAIPVGGAGMILNAVLETLKLFSPIRNQEAAQ